MAKFSKVRIFCIHCKEWGVLRYMRPYYYIIHEKDNKKTCFFARAWDVDKKIADKIRQWNARAPNKGYVEV
ncbi:MAG: hypothetical protein OEY88_07800 [Candidatus Bathyarchaeota archaeon]|nr:hypothetical protein [Candidatus Bathyarchaeota archaeon]